MKPAPMLALLLLHHPVLLVPSKNINLSRLRQKVMEVPKNQKLFRGESRGYEWVSSRLTNRRIMQVQETREAGAEFVRGTSRRYVIRWVNRG